MCSENKALTDDAEKLIPKGFYCYSHSVAIPNHPMGGRKLVGVCPYWSIREDKLSQENGYCSYLQRGDWEEGLTHLWTLCKECGINEPTDEEIERERY